MFKLLHTALTVAAISMGIVAAQEDTTPPTDPETPEIPPPTCKGVRDHVIHADTIFKNKYDSLLEAAESCTDCAEMTNSTTGFPEIQTHEITKWKEERDAVKACTALADDLGFDGVEYDWCALSVYMEDKRGVKRAVKKFYKNIFYECLPKICEDEKDMYEFFKQQKSPQIASSVEDCDRSVDCKFEYSYCDIIFSREGKEVKEPMLATLLNATKEPEESETPEESDDDGNANQNRR